MIITDRLKQLIFKHLYKELGNVEIIPYNGSVWFIDRENSYWYFQLSTQGCLYWRYSFFPSFFSVFSLGQSEFEPILSSGVEEVLNSKVSTTNSCTFTSDQLLEDILNHKVSETFEINSSQKRTVKKVLDSKVSTTVVSNPRNGAKVEEVLNHKVCETDVEMSVMNYVMEQVLNQ